MKAEFKFTFKKNYVEIIVNGEPSFELTDKLWSGAVEFCIANDCYRILGIANATKPISITNGYNHHEVFRKLGINHKYRMAWVELNLDSKVIENYQFTETVLQSRGLPGKLFVDVEEAKKWLLKNIDK